MTGGVRVFVSYRRADSRYITGRLCERLASAFGDSNVFFDVASISLGADFRIAIRDTIRTVDVVLVVIGPRFNVAGLGEDGDYVRMELLEAIAQGKLIVPVLVDDARLPGANELPEDLRGLAYRQASMLRTDPDFPTDAERLINGVRKACNLARARDSAQRSRSRDRQSSSVASPRSRSSDVGVADNTATSAARSRRGQLLGGTQVTEGARNNERPQEARVNRSGQRIAVVAIAIVLLASAWLVLSTVIADDDGASGDGSRTIQTANFGEEAVLRGHGEPVYSVAFSPTGASLASAGDDNTVRLWNISTGKLMRTLSGHEDGVRSVAFSPDGSRLASAGDDADIRVWVSATGQGEEVFTVHTNSVDSVAFSPDGYSLASGSADGTARLWDVREPSGGRMLYTITHSAAVRPVTFSPGGSPLVTADDDGSISLWTDSSAGANGEELDNDSPANSLALSSDGLLLASATDDGDIRVWDMAEGELVQTLQGHAGPVYSVAFSLDGDLLASGGDDQTVRIWDAAEGELVQTLHGHAGPVYSVAFSLDGDLLASGGDDETVRIWGSATP